MTTLPLTTREATVRYDLPTATTRHPLYPRLREAVAHALFLRRRLGLGLERAACSDAWVLANHYRERFDLVALPGWPSCIVFQPGRKDLILIDSEAGPWSEAHILCHEIGHSLFTRPGFPGSDYDREMLAEAFACAFLLWPLGETEDDGQRCCQTERPS